MKKFVPHIQSVRPPQKGEEVPMCCRSCGSRFYARDFGLLTAVLGAKCPECGGKDVEKDFRVVN